MPIPIGVLAQAGSGAIQYRAFVARDASNAIYRGVSVDSSENIFQAGDDGSVIKSDRFGNVIWGRRLSGVRWRDCAVDSNGDIVAVGDDNGSNGVVAKYNTNGVIQYQREITNFVVHRIHINSNGNYYLAGRWNPNGGSWGGEFTSTMTRNWLRAMDGVTQVGDICFYNGALFITTQGFTGSPFNRFESYLWGFNSSGQVLQVFPTATNWTNSFGGGVATDGTDMYVTPAMEISGAYRQLIMKVNSSYSITASRSYTNNNTTFGSFFDSTTSEFYLTTSEPVFKTNTSLTTQWQRYLQQITEGGLVVRNNNMYFPGGSGYLMKFPANGNDTGTYSSGTINVTYSIASITEVSPVPGIAFSTKTYGQGPQTPTPFASGYTDSSYTPSRQITGV